MKIALIVIPLAVVLVRVEYRWLRGRKEAAAAAWANDTVAEKIATARVHLAEQHWNRAIHQLEEALAVEYATNRDDARAVLAEAQRGQAEALREAANVALTNKQTAESLRLLHAYLAHPQAAHLDRARQLRDDIERALSDDEAARLLARLSDEALTVFAEKGQLTEDDGLHAAATHAIFQDTLRRNVPKELRQRQARREIARLSEERRAAERVRRIAHLRDTPSFRTLTAFLARTREESRDQRQRAQNQEMEVAELFQQLGVTDAAEQEKIRGDLFASESHADIRATVDRQRAEIKQAYRKSPEFNADDAPLFGQLVDREVDDFLKAPPTLGR
jgi:hypothetical protein